MIKKEDIKEDIKERIQELQSLEQNFQSLILQKQAFQMELNETEEAQKEVDKSKGDIYKIIGQIMIKTDLQETKANLDDKMRLLKLRINSLEKQESHFQEKIERTRKDILGEMKK